MAQMTAPGFVVSIIIALVVLWSIPWKGIALWQAARRKQLAWFVALLIINTAGILEIVYIFFIGPRTPER